MKGHWIQLAVLVTVLSLVAGCVAALPAPSSPAPPTFVPPTAVPAATFTTVPPTSTPLPPKPSEAPTALPTPPPRPTAQLIVDSITSQALAGNLLGDPAEREVYVLLPPGYSASEKRYPVVYVMPGGDGLPTHFTGGFTFASQELLGRDEIKEMILVFPDGTNRIWGGSLVSSSTIGDYETYVTRDVVDYVDTHYRTLPTRDSRGIGGCSNGGTTSMRLGLKYPNVFSVVAATDGEWDSSPQVRPDDVQRVQSLKELPKDVSDLDWVTQWWVQLAAGAAPDPDNPPFYCEMPFRIVNGRGEFVPEVVAKIVEQDAAHEARRYVQQPVRLRGIRIQHGTYDNYTTPSVHSFEQVLTDLGIEHEYVEVPTGHCGGDWVAASLKYMSDKLVSGEQ